MPRLFPPAEVQEILRSGEFDRLIGALEDEHLECKVAPYQLENDHQKMELAKDASALANADGGSVLLGVETGRDAVHRGDVVRRIRCFPQALVNVGQYEQVLGEWVYPRIRELRIAWRPSSADAARGIVAIAVPKESGQEQPYLVGKVIEKTGKTIGSYVGYFERLRDGVISLSVQELRERLKDGLRFADLDKRLENIEEILGRLIVVPAGEAPPPIQVATVTQRITRSRTIAGFEGKPSFILAAWPVGPTQFPTLFESREANVVRLLEHPPRLRAAGFDVSTRRTAQIVDGELRRCLILRSKLLELWRDGLLLFVTAGDGWHLCWGMRSDAATGLRINNLALAETTYLFSDLALKLFPHSVPPPGRLHFMLQLASMTVNGVPCSLHPHRPNDWNLDDDRHPAPGEERIVRMEIERVGSEPGGVCYRLLADLYAWFGFDAADMPYVDRAAGPPRIDPGQIS